MSIVSLSDGKLLKRTSTSPYAEAPTYPDTIRQLFTAIASLTTDDVFPGRTPRVYARSADGDWLKQ